MKIFPRSLTSRLLVVLAIILLVAAATLFLKARARRAAQEREAGYQATLRAYSRMFTSGMTRREVEAKLRDRGAKLRHLCCMDSQSPHNSLDTLIEIGREDAPWYCSQHTVHVGLEFSADGPFGFPEARDSDVLNEVRLFHYFDGCL